MPFAIPSPGLSPKLNGELAASPAGRGKRFVARELSRHQQRPFRTSKAPCQTIRKQVYYRSTEQLLGHEHFLFLSRVGRYANWDDDTAFRVLVERVEDAIAAENSATLNVMTTAAEASEAGKKIQAGKA